MRFFKTIFHQELTQLFRRAVLLGIQGYQYLLSPFLAPRCRFYPSCSAYAHECFDRLGLFKAIWKSLWRLLRCHPWNPGGVDLVEPHKPAKRFSNGLPKRPLSKLNERCPAHG